MIVPLSILLLLGMGYQRDQETAIVLLVNNFQCNTKYYFKVFFFQFSIQNLLLGHILKLPPQPVLAHYHDTKVNALILMIKTFVKRLKHQFILILSSSSDYSIPNIYQYSKTVYKKTCHSFITMKIHMFDVSCKGDEQ